jgi:hypothetical protein
VSTLAARRRCPGKQSEVSGSQQPLAVMREHDRHAVRVVLAAFQGRSMRSSASRAICSGAALAVNRCSIGGASLPQKHRQLLGGRLQGQRENTKPLARHGRCVRVAVVVLGSAGGVRVASCALGATLRGLVIVLSRQPQIIVIVSIGLHGSDGRSCPGARAVGDR